MFTGLRGTRASDHLDMIRGVAAVVVLLFHVRYRFFLDFADITSPGLVTRLWYIVTAFGHDAVMVFFVVSGFLVGSSAVRDLRSGQWRWSDYLIARGVRLYVVLIPGLLLTLGWDALGMTLFPYHAIYTGFSQNYINDFSSVSATLNWRTFWGNFLFLQTIRVPPFGSNAALWSLAFEFWYYLAFPLMATVAFSRTAPWRRALAAVAALAVLYFAGQTIALYFPLWLLGLVVGMLPSTTLVVRRRALWSAATGVVFLTWLGVGHLGSVKAAFGSSLLAIDACTGVTFALWLYTLLHDRRPANDGVYGITARALAAFSYTLYLVHLPLLVFLRAWLVPDRPWAVTPTTVGAAGVITLVALAYAYAVAHLTEANTSRLRKALSDWWRRDRVRQQGEGKRQPAFAGDPHGASSVARRHQ